MAIPEGEGLPCLHPVLKHFMQTVTLFELIRLGLHNVFDYVISQISLRTCFEIFQCAVRPTEPLSGCAHSALSAIICVRGGSGAALMSISYSEVYPSGPLLAVNPMTSICPSSFTRALKYAWSASCTVLALTVSFAVPFIIARKPSLTACVYRR